MKLMVDPNAEPVAHHTPVPVPLHWRDAVKAGLDHDVQLGVLEHITRHHPFIRLDRFRTVRRRRSLMHGTDTIACPSAEKTDT